jgi:hypothetical protein
MKYKIEKNTVNVAYQSRCEEDGNRGSIQIMERENKPTTGGSRGTPASHQGTSA